MKWAHFSFVGIGAKSPSLIILILLFQIGVSSPASKVLLWSAITRSLRIAKFL